MIRKISVLMVSALTLLAACAAPPPSAAPTNQPVSTPATQAESQPTVAPQSAAAYPVTIEHKFGSTTIPAERKRVLALGYNEQDPILALGVVPVGVRYWFGDESKAAWPWSEQMLNGQQPMVLNMPFGQLNLEAIAALKPDLILGVSSGITDKEYAALSAIAPVVPQTDEFIDFGVPWEAMTLQVGQALGKEDQANALIAQAQAKFAAAREAHPEFKGKTAVIAAPAPEGKYYFYGPQDVRARFLAALGLELPQNLADIAGDSFFGQISAEKMDLFDVDVLIWFVSPDARKELEANPIYGKLKVVQDGRVILLDSEGKEDLIAPAMSYNSVLSFDILFENLVPKLAQAAKVG